MPFALLKLYLIQGLLHFMVFFMGTVIGSFLNVVIYRLPLGISVNNPRRSFCPSCKYQIPLRQNIPLLSWCLLRGKCAKCGGRISPRYLGVELLTGVLFYALYAKVAGTGGDWHLWQQWGPEVLCLWIFASLLVAGSFIDIDHFILPHEITLGGAAVGLICAALVPQRLGYESHWQGFLMSLASAALGMGVLWLVVELGKLLFGRLRQKFESAKSWSITQPDEDQAPVLTCEDAPDLSLAEVYARATDRLVLTCPQLQVNELEWSDVKAEVWVDKLKVKTADHVLKAEFPLTEVKRLAGKLTEIVIPREAMGFGDVLLMITIGSFIGWKGALFTIVAASILGSVIGGGSRLIGRSEWGQKLPFGPYLAAGALIWIFAGPEFLEWYQNLLLRRQMGG
jgi:leader peptidase (prepilin peptidase) / N-methyltransferase